MMSRFIVLCLLSMVFLSGCTETLPIVPRPPDLTFDNFRKIDLNVSKVEVFNNYKPPMKDPNVEHLFPVPPYSSAEKLVRQQLVAAGNQNTLRVNIDDASVVRQALPVNKGIDNLLTRLPAEQLNAKVVLHFELFSPRAPDIVIGHAEVIARRTKTLLEGATVADRDQAYFNLTADLMTDLNNGLRTVVKNTFGKKP